MTPQRRYGVAALTVVVSAIVGAAIEQGMNIGRLPYALFMPGVLITTAVAGPSAGLLATVLGPIGAELAVPHRHVFPSSALNAEITGLMVYVAAGVGIAVIAGRLTRARSEADAAAAEATRRSDELVRAREAVDRLARDAQRRARDFSTLFEEAPIGIGIAEDVECRHIVPNRALAEMLGVTPGQNISQTEAEGRIPLTITTPDGTPVPNEELALRRAARTGQTVRGVDVDVVRPDGARISLLAFAAPLLDDDGRPRGAIGAFLDVSNRRRDAEEQQFLAEATRLLNSSLDYQSTLGQLVRLAVPQLTDYSLLDVLTPEGEVVRVGLAHRDPTREAALTRILVATPPNQGVRGNRGLLNLVRAGRPVLWNDVSREFLTAQGLRPDQVEFVLSVDVNSCAMVPLVLRERVIGAFAWVRHSGRPRFDDRDVALAEEVARRAAAAVENARLYREAQTANRLKDEFVATLSHELRTPLNALLGWTELLVSRQLPPDRQRPAVEAIERTARLQAQIINDLVDVSQAASGAFRLSPRPVAAGEVVRNAAEAFRLAAESKGVRLGVHVAADMPPVVVDPDRLQQIVFNLVANAVKFTPGGTVDVHARVEQGRLEVDVHDTGIGIPAPFLPFVFDRFRQADGSTSRQYGGLGLGLSIVRSLVELHGGQVQAHSEGEGRGATFSMWIPAGAAALSAAQVADAAGESG